MPVLNKTFLKTLKTPEKDDCVYWDDTLKGFGLRVQKGQASYICYYRNGYGKQQKVTIGKASKVTPYLAREEAKKILAEVVQGKDPQGDKQAKRHAMTVNELCDWYIKEGMAHKKISTIKTDISRIESHIKPLIGNEAVKAIRRGDIQKMIVDITSGEKTRHRLKLNKPRAVSYVRGGKGTASRTIATLSAIFSFAINNGLIDYNPCIGVKKPAYAKKDVFLTLEEMRRFGELLNRPDQQAIHKQATNALKLIALTGCRKGEIESLRWEYIDLKGQCIHFPDTKTGKQTRPIGLGAIHLLTNLAPQKTGWVFPASAGEGHMDALPRIFNGLKGQHDGQGDAYINPEATIHTLRHSFASLGANLGYSDFTIAGLLGHSLHTMTSRYMHAVDKSLISAADAISLKIEQALSGQEGITAQIVSISKSA